MGQSIKCGAIVIGKRVPKKDNIGRIGAEGIVYDDDSVVIKNDEIGYIDNVVIARQKKDVFNTGLSDDITSLSYCAKVKVRSNRPPQIGDKFSSRHG